MTIQTFQGATRPRRQSEEPGSARPSITLDERKVANIVVAKHLNRASRDIQIQALEVRFQSLLDDSSDAPVCETASV